MSVVGYSGTPLLKKLGIKPEMKVLVLNMPKDYMALLESDVSSQFVLPKQMPDLVHLFSKDSSSFKAGMKTIMAISKLNTSVVIWVSWYKKSAGIGTDMTEDLIREFALKNGLVDVKVCAVSNEWSGLKLVVPVSKR